MFVNFLHINLVFFVVVHILSYVVGIYILFTWLEDYIVGGRIPPFSCFMPGLWEFI